MSFGASGCCMHPFIQEETDNIVLQINRFAPYVTGERTKIHISQPSTWCGPTRRRRPSPAAHGADRETEPWPGSSWTRFPTGPASSWASAGCPMRWGTASPLRTTWAATQRSCRTPSWPDEGGGHQQQRPKFIPGKTVVGFAFGSKASTSTWTTTRTSTSPPSR